MTGSIARTLGNDPSPRVRAAVMVDRWIYKRFDDTFWIDDGELFERALELQQETDRLGCRHLFELPMRLISSPFEKTRKKARRVLMPRFLP